MQHLRHRHFAVRPALFFRQRGQGVELAQRAVFARRHAGGQRKRVTTRALARRLVNCVQPRLGRLQPPRLMRQGVKRHGPGVAHLAVGAKNKNFAKDFVA